MRRARSTRAPAPSRAPRRKSSHAIALLFSGCTSVGRSRSVAGGDARSPPDRSSRACPAPRPPRAASPRRRQISRRPAGVISGGARPRVAAAHAVDEVARPARSRRSQPSSFLRRGASVARRAVLRHAAASASRARRAFAAGRRAPSSASRADSSPAVSSGPIGVASREQHVARVHARVHLERGDAGLRLAADDRPRDGRRAAIARQQRGVDVDRPARGRVEHGLRQDLAERHHHRDVGAERAPGAPATRDRAAARGCSTGTPAASARRFTGGGVERAARGRPAGRAG